MLRMLSFRGMVQVTRRRSRCAAWPPIEITERFRVHRRWRQPNEQNRVTNDAHDTHMSTT